MYKNVYTFFEKQRCKIYVLLIIAQYFHKTVYIFLMFYYELSVFLLTFEKILGSKYSDHMHKSYSSQFFNEGT